MPKHPDVRTSTFSFGFLSFLHLETNTMKLLQPHQYDTIRAVAEMNVNAIHLYLQGDGRLATKTLIQALRILHHEECDGCGQLTGSIVHRKREENIIPLESRHHEDRCNFPIRCITRIRTTASISFESTGSNGGDIHMYHRPFLIDSDTSTNSIEVHDTGEISATLLFNLALVHHEAGMRLGNSSLLRKALKVYEHGLQYLRNASKSLVLMAALCNNRLNLLITYFYDIANARKMLNFIDSILTQIEYEFVLARTRDAIEVLYDPNSPAQSLSIQELHHFRLSLAFVKIHNLRFAPAA